MGYSPGGHKESDKTKQLTRTLMGLADDRMSTQWRKESEKKSQHRVGGADVKGFVGKGN